MSKQATKRLRRHLGLPVNREPLPAYAWPGGYPLIYVFRDGGCICPKCLNANVEEIEQASRGDNRHHPSGCGGWAVDAVDVHWEGEPVCCEQCHGEIESAYGMPETPKPVVT